MDSTSIVYCVVEGNYHLFEACEMSRHCPLLSPTPSPIPPCAQWRVDSPKSSRFTFVVSSERAICAVRIPPNSWNWGRPSLKLEYLDARHYPFLFVVLGAIAPPAYIVWKTTSFGSLFFTYVFIPILVVIFFFLAWLGSMFMYVVAALKCGSRRRYCDQMS